MVYIVFWQVLLNTACMFTFILSDPFMSCYFRNSEFCFQWFNVTDWRSSSSSRSSPSDILCVCVCVFSVDRLQSGVSWYCLFKQYYRDLGRYIKYYPVLKRAWEQLKNFLQQRCPRMIASLKGDGELSTPAGQAVWPLNVFCVAIKEVLCLFSSSEGATEVELNDSEAQIGCRLPDDYRCSYRIHNGQKLVIPGSVSVCRRLPLTPLASPSNRHPSVCVSSG